jgi:hypothetical protein
MSKSGVGFVALSLLKLIMPLESGGLGILCRPLDWGR